MKNIWFGFFVAAVGILAVGASAAQQFDPAPAWPLCGRIAEAPPPGWVDADGCPPDRWGDPTHADLPVSSAFGPRPLGSANDRYDFHRGIDLAAGYGTPVFAMADGIVRIAGVHSAYEDPLVQLRHFRPGASGCSGTGCYHTNYMHLSDWTVAAGDTVSKGGLIGYTGASASGFEHLHFEIRNATPDDPFSSWQRDSINSIQVLPYAAPGDAVVTFNRVDQSVPLAPIVEVTVNAPRPDINRVEVVLYDAADQHVVQPGNTPDARGYNVYPSWFDMTVWNRQYTHKDSSGVPWESFGPGGENECPFHAQHGASYDPHVHLDRPNPDDFRVGRFNGITIRTADYDPGNYYLNLTFEALEGPAQCIVAKVVAGNGDTVTYDWGDCSGLAAPVADGQLVETAPDVPVDVTLTASDANADPLSFAVVSQPANGTLIGTAPDLTYQPDAGFVGTDSITFLANDGLADSLPESVEIVVGGGTGNGAPTADAQSVTTRRNTAVAVTLTGSDPDGDPLIFTTASQPTAGTLSGTAPDLTYTPDADVTGADQFAFEVNDGNGGSDTAIVSITIKKGRGGGNGKGGKGKGGKG